MARGLLRAQQRGTPGGVPRRPPQRRWRGFPGGIRSEHMGITSTARIPQRWWGAAGVALVTLLAVIGCYVEANPAHTYAGLHLASHPPPAAYLLIGLPAIALLGRNRYPVAVFFLTVIGAVAWAALGQIDGAALVPVIVALYWLALTRPRSV